MMRTLLKLVLPLTLLFAAIIGLLRLPLYRDDALADFFAPPEGCPAPCWLGIRPGVTTSTEALNLLNAHPWVERVVIGENSSASRSGFIEWDWSGQQPAPIDGRARGRLRVTADIVRLVNIPTTIPFGALWLRFNRPPKGSFIVALYARTMDHITIHYAAYPDLKFVAWNEIGCPLTVSDFWGAPVVIQFAETPEWPIDDYRLPGWGHESPCA